VTLASRDGAAGSVRVPRGTAPPAQEGRAIGERIPLYTSASDPSPGPAWRASSATAPVLRLVAAGYSTRLQLRNRSHAVAYAVRQGLI
jgi:hypothetical protein